MNDLSSASFVAYIFIVDEENQYGPTVVRKRYEKDFFDKIENAGKIFIPINDQGVHWYLMVVDFVERKIYLLDSLPCANRKLLRQRDVLRVALFLEEMFIHNSFYDCGIKLENHLISNFPRQRYGS
ncbi:putative Ulp1 protease family catalytic domain-containing protein [Medicago truncatula]|uniref:Putative Ulp1 protease family catalytic domain-containing protein n=1 Tax=Medicago truncatula TaxID=3880 RepID=A0A396GMM1_MEDTR|nr:putative Ulp1 protease family catalytic domain-containing protein [Medicago truncatula]